ILLRANSVRARWLSTPVASGPYRPWLTGRGSLTRQLQQRCHDFRVRPTRLCRTRPRVDEARLLGKPVRSHALLREVQLFCGDRAVVFAQSLLPRQSLRGRWQGLRALGSRPLGSELFAWPSMRRACLEYRKLAWHHQLYRRAAAQLDTPPPTLWA